MSRRHRPIVNVLESLESRRMLADITGAVFVAAVVQPQANRTVYLDLNNNGQLDAEPTAVTNASGEYAFAGLDAGTYHVRLNIRPSLIVQTPVGGEHVITVTDVQTSTGNDFGLAWAYTQPIPDPNATLATAIPLGGITDPVVVDDYYALNSDREMFRFTAAAGQTLNFSIDSEGDHFIMLFDSAGNDLVGRIGGGAREFLSHTFDSAGTYYVGVSTSRNTLYDPTTPGGTMGFNNGFLGDYALTVSDPNDQPGAGQWDGAEVFGVHRIYGGSIEGVITTQNDVDLFHFETIAGGGPGGAFGAKIIPQGDLKLNVKVYSNTNVLLYQYGPATAARPLAVPFSLLNDNYYVEVSSDGQTTGDYRINVYASLGDYDSDKSYFMPINSGSFTGQPLSAREFIQYQGDVNVHAVQVQAGQRAKIRVAADDGATLDPFVRVFRVVNGQEINLGQNDNAEAGIKAAEVTIAFAQTETIYIEVKDAGGTGIGDYTIAMTDSPQPNRAPAIGNLSATPSPVVRGQTLKLIATDVADPDNDAVAHISFIHDTNNNGLYDTGDTLLGADINGANGWAINVSTTDLSPGEHRFFAYAFDGVLWSAKATTTATIQPVPVDPATPVRSDFDGDGKADLLLHNTSTGQTQIGLMDGVTIRQTINLPTLADTNWRAVAIADFNADGKADILWQNNVTRRNSVWLMDGTTIQSFRGMAYVPNADWKLRTAGDFDGDAKPDLVWQNTTTGDCTFWLMNDTQIKGYKGFARLNNPQYTIAAAADFNADGHTDLLWQSQPQGGFTVLWQMNRTALSRVVDNYEAVAPTQVVRGVLDVDMDGDCDVLFDSIDTAGTRALLMNGPLSTGAYQPLADRPDVNWVTLG